jgi:hypothetical protein
MAHSPLPTFVLLAFVAALGPGLIIALNVKYRLIIDPLVVQIGHVSPGLQQQRDPREIGDTAFMLYSSIPWSA